MQTVCGRATRNTILRVSQSCAGRRFARANSIGGGNRAQPRWRSGVFMRESGGHDAQSERLASWQGQARQPRFDPGKSLVS